MRIFILLTGSTALRFMLTGGPPAARRIQILPINQHAWRPITFEMKWLQFIGHKPHYGPGVDSASDRNEYKESSWWVKSGRPPSVSLLSRKCGILDVSQPYGPPWPVTGIDLPFLSFSNCVPLHALDFDIPVSCARRFSDFLGVCSSLSPVPSNFSVSTRRMFLFLVYSEFRCSKFIDQIVNCLSAGNSFITKFKSKFWPAFSSRLYLT
jgi:hypothetical protein